MPVIVERQADVATLQDNLQGHVYDIEYSLGAIKSFNDTEESFNRIHELLKNAIFLKQQLKYVESRRPPKRETASANSMYKRLSSHIPIDLSDLSDRVESIVSGSSSRAAGTAPQPPPPTELQKSNTSMY